MAPSHRLHSTGRTWTAVSTNRQLTQTGRRATEIRLLLRVSTVNRPIISSQPSSSNNRWRAIKSPVTQGAHQLLKRPRRDRCQPIKHLASTKQVSTLLKPQGNLMSTRMVRFHQYLRVPRRHRKSISAHKKATTMEKDQAHM